MLFTSLKTAMTTTPAPVANYLGGVVTVEGVPAARRVVVLRRVDLSYVGAAWSAAADGAWRLLGVPAEPPGSLLVLALDSGTTYNAEVADHISQVVPA